MNDASINPTGYGLVRYNAMCHAIAAAHEIDEVMDIHDKARALEVYAMQSKNTDAEWKACEIRLRAERKAGQMLGLMEKAKGTPGNQHTGPLPRGDGSKTLEDYGISPNQSSRWQKLAAVPDDEFEATFAQPDRKPSTTGIINASHPTEPGRPTVDPKALWLWGRLLDFEREGLLAADPNDLIRTMLAHMKETTADLAPRVAKWLGRINK